MVRSYPLDMPGVEFRGHSVTGIYEMNGCIAFVHFAFGVPSELEIAQKLTPNYVLLDTFSRDFSEHKRSTLTYKQSEIFIASNARCYPENGYFVLNTRYYKGYINSPAKLIKISDGQMSELGEASEPVKEIYNDAKTYKFDGFCVRMSSPFMMECKEILGGAEPKSEAKDENLNANLPPKEQGARIGKSIWRLKLGAYLYTPVCLNDGVLYFGTAGKGGDLYAVDVKSGEVMFKFKTSGTEHFVWVDGQILLANHKNKPVLISAKDGLLLKEIEFEKFRLSADQIMLVSGGRLYAVANDGAKIYAVCAEI
ncbi:PQQ-binding-like beta-propeller repeat protein [Campylobacter concisus]|uniref:PQQ-binding-like beta-propeller repeat protein n=1 Tax=Campylobacter concisus TaxID=199 RepID=UPI003D233251